MIEQDKDNCKINSVRYCNLFNLSLPWVESNKCDVTKKEKKTIWLFKDKHINQSYHSLSESESEIDPRYTQYIPKSL